MEKTNMVEKLYKLVTGENLEMYRVLLNNTKISDATDPYWKETLAFYGKLSYEEREVLINIIKQISIDTVSNILAILDGKTSLEGQDDEFVIMFEKTKEKINGDLQDLFLEIDELKK